MKLPEGADAVIDPRKLLNYSLNFEHDDGKHKAALFRELLGITVENVDRLVKALSDAAVSGDATMGRHDRYGQRYQIDFNFSGLTGSAVVRSVWIVGERETVPRLVTCYIL
mgnify:FL=1